MSVVQAVGLKPKSCLVGAVAMLGWKRIHLKSEDCRQVVDNATEPLAQSIDHC